MSETIFTNLQKILAYLYSDEQSIRRIATESGIAIVLVVINSSAINNWHSVITEARKANLIDALLAAVEKEYGTNNEFRRACDDYHQAKSYNSLIQLPQKAPEPPKNERLNSNEYDYSKKNKTKGDRNNPLARSADEVKAWFFQELHPKEQSLLLTTALLEGMSRQKLVQVMTDIEQILSN